MSFDLNKIYDTIKTQISTLPVVQAHIQAVEISSSVEHFTLPPFPPTMPSFQDILKKNPEDQVVQTFVKYNVDQREVYDVISDFDQSPNNLSQQKATLRKKYLNIILSVMDDRNDMMKKTLTQMSTNSSAFGGPGGPGGPGGRGGRGQQAGEMSGPEMQGMFLLYGLGNYDPGYNTIKRIIKLLIMEIDLNGSTTCPVSPPCAVCAVSPPCAVCAVSPPCAVCAVSKCEQCNDNTYIGVIVALIIILVIMSIILGMSSGGAHAPMPI